MIDSYDVLLFTESWLNESVKSDELEMFGYVLYRCDRSASTSQCGRGGGVLIAVKKHLSSSLLPIQLNNLEQVFVSVTMEKSILIFGCVYLPPRSSTIVYEQYCLTVDFVLQQYRYNAVILTGDFNLPNVTWVNDLDGTRAAGMVTCQAECISNYFAFLNFYQCNNVTNVNSNTLDLVFSSSRDVTVAMVEEPFLKCDQYHPALRFDIFIPEKMQLLHFDYYYYNFKIAPYDQIIAFLAGIDWNDILNENRDINEIVGRFYDIVMLTIDLYVPKCRAKNLKFPEWMSPDLKNLTIYKKTAHKDYKATGTVESYNRFADARRKCKELSVTSRNDYINRVESSILCDSGEFWKYVHKKNDDMFLPSSMSYQGNVADNAYDIVNMFATFFGSVYTRSSDLPTGVPYCDSPVNLGCLDMDLMDVFNTIEKLRSNLGMGPDNVPYILIYNCRFVLAPVLCKIYSISLSTGQFPEIWKMSYITPIFKSGNRHEVENYRAISKISLFSKIFEQIVTDKIFDSLGRFLCPEQHGFLRGRSTVSNLLVYTEFLSEALERRCQVDAVYTDFSKAFDRVNHGVLMAKLAAFGVSGCLYSWIIDYLTDRKQIVSINNVQSSVINATSGVPQGGHLSPLLFNIFVNDLSTRITNSNFLLYADDFKVYKCINSLNDCILLQQDLDRFGQWCQMNDLTLNVGKCNIMQFYRIQSPIMFNYSIGSTILQKNDFVRDLGVTFDCKLTFNLHIENICNKSLKLLGFLTRTLNEFSNIYCFKVLYCSIVRSILEYASPIWNPSYKKYVDMLEKIQRKFLRVINYKLSIPIDQLDYCQLALLLNLDSLESRRFLMDVNTLFKIINNNIDCSALLDRVHFAVPQRDTRNFNLFFIPYHRTNYGQTSPISRLSRCMNKLDLDLFHLSLNQFRRLSRTRIRVL